MSPVKTEEAGSGAALSSFRDAKADRPATLPSLFKNPWPAVFLADDRPVDIEDLTTAGRHPLQWADQHVVLRHPTAKPLETTSDWREHIAIGRYGNLQWDDFVDQGVVEKLGVRVPLNDVETTRLIFECERAGFKNISRSSFEHYLKLVAKSNSFDSAQEWLLNLPAWDRTFRIERFASDYLGTEDTPYTKAGSRYLWTSMASRILYPGCKADMMPVFVGPQGIGKSSAAAIIAPTQDHCGEACISDRGPDLVRKVFGKTLLLWEELRGILGRFDADEVKTFITSQYVETRSRSHKGMDRHKRRFIIIGTTNRMDFLRDPTGNRRYLPFEVGSIDLKMLSRDKLQLWAETLHVIREREAQGKTPVDYEDAERLAADEHWAFLKAARWLGDEQLIKWLAGRTDRFTTEDALKAVGMHQMQITPRERREMADTLRQMGCSEKRTRVGNSSLKRWCKP